MCSLALRGAHGRGAPGGSAISPRSRSARLPARELPADARRSPRPGRIRGARVVAVGPQRLGVGLRGRAREAPEPPLEPEQGGRGRQVPAEPHAARGAARTAEPRRARRAPSVAQAADARAEQRARRPPAARPRAAGARRHEPAVPPSSEPRPRSGVRAALRGGHARGASAHLARVGRRRARGERARLRLRRRARRRRVERHPADALEPDLDPGVRVEVAHAVLAACPCCTSPARSPRPRAPGCRPCAASAPSRPRTAGSSRGAPRRGSPSAGSAASAPAPRRCSCSGGSARRS